MSPTPIDPLLVAAITMVLRRARRDWPAMDAREIMWRLNDESLHETPARNDLRQAVQSWRNVEHHLHAMKAMGLITDGPRELWRFTNQAEIKQHLGMEARPRGRDRVLQLQPLPEGHGRQASEPPEPPDGGGRRGGGNDGEGPGDGDGGGRGIGEVLDHPVLFALSASDFNQYVDQLFSGAGAP